MAITRFVDVGGVAGARLRVVEAGRPYREEFIADAGHWPQQESADEFNRILLDFLQGLDRW